jgi:hypothetical protein
MVPPEGGAGGGHTVVMAVVRVIRAVIAIVVMVAWLPTYLVGTLWLVGNGSTDSLVLFAIAATPIVLLLASVDFDDVLLVMMVLFLTGLPVVLAAAPAYQLHFGQPVAAVVAEGGCAPSGDDPCAAYRVRDPASERDLGRIACLYPPRHGTGDQVTVLADPRGWIPPVPVGCRTEARVLTAAGLLFATVHIGFVGYRVVRTIRSVGAGPRRRYVRSEGR